MTEQALQTEIGEVSIQVPRDRQETFESTIVQKHQRRIAGFHQAVIWLYAKGMTTGDIVAHLSEVYGEDASRELVSKVTDQVLDDLLDWHQRPLDRGRFLAVVANDVGASGVSQ